MKLRYRRIVFSSSVADWILENDENNMEMFWKNCRMETVIQNLLSIVATCIL